MLGEKIGDTSDLFFVLFVITLIAYCMDWLNIIVCVFLNKCGELFTVMTYIFLFLSNGSYFALLITYLVTLSSLREVNMEIVGYAAENNCSDEVLNFAFDKFNDNFSHNVSVTGVGLAFTLVSLILNLLFSFLFTGLRKYFCYPCRNMSCIS